MSAFGSRLDVHKQVKTYSRQNGIHLCGNKRHREKFNSWLPVEILSNSINPASHSLKLGVSFDADFNFQCQINNTVKSCNYYIRDIVRILTIVTRCFTPPTLPT